MQEIRLLADLWPIFAGGIGVIVWLVRLEGRVTAVNDKTDHNQKDVTALGIKHESLDSKIVEQLSEVKQSLARLEGALGIKHRS